MEDTLHIPKSMIYEMVDGHPIYYKGYKSLLQNPSKPREAMGSSLLQSLIISKMVILLHEYLGSKYIVLTNEIGIRFSKGNWRAADIAVFETDAIETIEADNKYVDIPPRLVIEMDTKAELDEVSDTFTYYNKKTQQLLDFGVDRVIWIFTETQKVLTATPGNTWILADWSTDIDIFEGLTVYIPDLIGVAPGKGS